MALAIVAAACQSEERSPDSSDEFVQWALPDKLREISGLALTSDQRLLAVADEEAIVYEIDYTNGSLVKAFAAGDPTLRGDFEGIAVLNGTVWLLESNGRLYSFTEAGDGERVSYERIKTRLGDECEFEGLAADEQSSSLLLVCKESRRKKKGLRIYAWNTEEDDEQEPVEIALPDDELGDSIETKRVNPSGIAVDPSTGHRIVLAARQRAVFELTRDGELIDVIMRLDARRHQQPEGIAITNNGRMLVADEANKGPATLAIYRAAQREKTD